jgi:hypothetical protein
LNQIPHFYNDEYLIRGKVGKDLTVEAAYEAARSCALALLGTLKDEVDDLDSVQIVKIHGFVNCVDGFSEHSKVINGASDFLVEVLGPERGRHCRIGKSLSIHFTVNCVLWKQFSLSLSFFLITKQLLFSLVFCTKKNGPKVSQVLTFHLWICMWLCSGGLQFASFQCSSRN